MGLAAVLMLAAAFVAFAMGAVIDLSRWRDAVAARASAALGRPVQLQGALQLRLGRELVLRIGGIRLPSPPGFDAQTFASVDQTKLRIDLFDVLRGRLRLRGIEARDIGLWLERAADGRGNWGEAPPREAAAEPVDIDIGPIALQRVSIHVNDARSAARRRFELDTLTLLAAPDQPLHLALRGRDELGAPYRLELEGGSLQRLLDRAAPWPFELDFHASALRLHAGGALDAAQGAARFDFDADADDLARAGQPWGLALPTSVAAALRGSVAATAQAVELNLVQGRLAGSGMAGRLRLDLAGARPRLQGRLQIDELDLRPLLAGDTQAPSAGIDDGLQQPVPRFERLPLDLDLGLEVQRWAGLPAELNDLQLQLQADARGLRTPLRATVAGAALSGRLDLDTASPSPQLALQLAASDVAIGNAAAGQPAAPGLQGRLGRAELRLGGRGATWGALVHDLELSLVASAMRLQHRGAGDAKPFVVTIDRMALAAARGEALRGSASGALDGGRARLSFGSASLPELLRERALPLEAELATAPATLRIASVIAPAAARDIDLQLQLQARRSADLARWLPVSPQSSLPLDLRARVHSVGDGWSLEQATLQLGRSDLQVDAQRRVVDGRPLTTAAVRSRLIDAAELATLRAAAPTPSGGGPLELPDAELDLRLQRVLLGRTELHDLALSARTQEGRLLPVTVSGRVAGAPFTANAELDLGDKPAAKLELSTGAIDIGALLHGLGVAQDIAGQADGLRLSLATRGSSPAEWAQHTAFDARLDGGRVTLQGPVQRPVAEIGVKLAFLGAAAGEPVRGRLVGTIDELPLRIDLATGSFADFARDASRLPFSMAARAAGSRLSLDGEVSLPLGSDGKLILDLGGERLDALSELARVELPPWGPWSLRAPIRPTPVGYELQDLSVRVGQSRLGGSARLDLSGPRPQLQMQVAAPSIQLDDFPPPQRLVDEPAADGGAEGLRASAGRMAGRADRLLSARFLRRFDASIDVKAREVLSGVDRLADGHLHLELQQGKLTLDPAQVNLPGGSLRLSMGYDLKEAQLDFEMAAAVQRFDYGILARRRQPTSNLRGLFSLDMKVRGTAPGLDKILPRASGHLDFAVWPTELRSGMFDLWSANLVLTLLPLIDPGVSPQINCIVGRFDLQDGKLTGETMVIDTTSVRIRGAGGADLANEQLGFVFRPRAKGPGLFRLQTPLRVGGTFDDQRFYVTQGELLESVLRMIVSPVLVPIERLRYGPLPRDGADVCTDPLRLVRG